MYDGCTLGHALGLVLVILWAKTHLVKEFQFIRSPTIEQYAKKKKNQKIIKARYSNKLLERKI